MTMISTSNYLSNFEINASEIRKKDIYLKADIVELVCLQNTDQQIPLDEALDEQMGEDEGIGGIVNVDEGNLENQEFSEELPDRAQSSSSAERIDSLFSAITDISEHIRSRSRLFGEYYPFSYENNIITRKQDITKHHKLYILLLIASHLRFWPREDRNLFANDFEILSTYAMKNLFPAWTIKIMGTAQNSSFSTYTGGRKKKLEDFAHDLGLRLIMDERELQHYDAPHGDGQLDVVAWYSFADDASNFPTILGQAGCTESEQEMLSKQINVQIWSNRLRGLSALACFFTPQHYRVFNYAFVEPSRISGIFLDRYRIMSLLKSDPDFSIDAFSSMQKIETIFL